jgi:hypothetical protein
MFGSFGEYATLFKTSLPDTITRSVPDPTVPPSTTPPPLELTVVVEPLRDPEPWVPPQPPGIDRVMLGSVGVATAALVFAALTWWTFGG